MNDLRRLIAGAEPVVALSLSIQLSAKLAEAAGFRALYLGGEGPHDVILEQAQEFLLTAG